MLSETMDSYDVCILGGGPSGYAAAMRAADFNKKTLLVERDRIGGAGVYNGALSSKTFWELSREIAAMRGKLARYHLPMPEIHYGNILKEVDEATFERAAQLEQHLRLLCGECGDDFEYVQGTGRLVGPHEVELRGDFDPYTIEAENIVIATGSRPRRLPGIPIDEHTILTSDGIGNLRDFPESLVIVGAGVIGCEFATIFSNFGRTDVHLLARDTRILPFEDADLSAVVERNLERNGVTIHRQTNLTAMEIVDGRVAYTVETPEGVRQMQAEKALISIGRIPNIESTGARELGVTLERGGTIDARDTQTNLEHIYAVGDMTADIALVNVGELEGRHAIEKMFGRAPRPLIYENISTIMFLKPEVAGVGMNEQQAQRAGIDYRAALFDYACIPRAVAMRNTEGFFKILVTDDGEKKILGMRALGAHASSAIQAVALLISMHKGIDELAELIHPHPSIIEGIQECVRMLLGKSIYKPHLFNERLRYRCYRDGAYMEGREAVIGA